LQNLSVATLGNVWVFPQGCFESVVKLEREVLGNWQRFGWMGHEVNHSGIAKILVQMRSPFPGSVPEDAGLLRRMPDCSEDCGIVLEHVAIAFLLAVICGTYHSKV
jgi:hypothetical protein